jgi:hypothetical protein
MIRRLIIALACCLVSGEAFAQAAFLPYAVTGQTSTGQLITAPNPANASAVPLNDTTGVEPSYSAAASFSATTGVMFAVCGSATKVVELRSLLLGGTATTAGSQIINLVKTSTAPGAGTAITPTAMDTLSATATATAQYYTSAPAAGTAIGPIDIFQMGFPVATSLGIQLPSLLVPAAGRQPIVLRGTGQCIEVQTNSSALTGELMQVTITWTEGTTAP